VHLLRWVVWAHHVNLDIGQSGQQKDQAGGQLQDALKLGLLG